MVKTALHGFWKRPPFSVLGEDLVPKNDSFWDCLILVCESAVEASRGGGEKMSTLGKGCSSRDAVPGV